MSWTKPYCGLTHLENGPVDFQITVEERKTFVLAHIHRKNNLTKQVEKKYEKGEVEKAKKWCERRAKILKIGE